MVFLYTPCRDALPTKTTEKRIQRGFEARRITEASESESLEKSLSLVQGRTLKKVTTKANIHPTTSVQ